MNTTQFFAPLLRGPAGGPVDHDHDGVAGVALAAFVDDPLVHVPDFVTRVFGEKGGELATQIQELSTEFAIRSRESFGRLLDR